LKFEKYLIFKHKQIRPKKYLKYFSNIFRIPPINLKSILNAIKYCLNTFTQMLFNAAILPIVNIKHINIYNSHKLEYDAIV